jgi:hypothetical protein
VLAVHCPESTQRRANAANSPQFLHQGRIVSQRLPQLLVNPVLAHDSPRHEVHEVCSIVALLE